MHTMNRSSPIKVKNDIYFFLIVKVRVFLKILLQDNYTSLGTGEFPQKIILVY